MSSIADLEQAYQEAAARVSEIERNISAEIVAARNAINEKWAAELHAASRAKGDAVRAVEAAKVEAGASHPLNGKRVTKTERQWRGGGYEHVQVFGVVEIFSRQTERPANMRYGLPSLGSPIVRLLKKDGKPGTKIEKLTPAWAPADQS